MSQQVSKREQDQAEQMRREREGTAGLVQCQGCPACVLVAPARPGHRDDCEECSRHCVCFHDSLSSGPDA